MKAPGFLTDLYGDLRDRKLLPLVAILLVAIVALPFLLSSNPEPPPPNDDAVLAAQAAAEDVPSIPAVLAADPGLRDYRERLSRLSEKNPFHEQVDDLEKAPAGTGADSVPTASELGSDLLSEPAASPAGTAGGAPSSSSSGGGGDVNIDLATDETVSDGNASTGGSSATNTGGGGSGGDSGGSGGSGGEGGVLAFRVDVEVGPAGDLERRRNVKLLTTLPSQSNPVLLFLGASEDGKHAVFLVSDDVETARGDGHCLPTPADCQFLKLKRHDEMKLGYAPAGEPDTYVIRLLDIRLKRNEDTVNSDRGAHSGSAIAGLDSFLGG
jgi:hypothetical protein